MSANLLIASALAAVILAVAGYLTRALRGIHRLQHEVGESARMMAQINVSLAQQLFVDGHFTEAAHHESLAAALETLAEESRR